MKNWPRRPPAFATPILAEDLADRRTPPRQGELTYARPSTPIPAPRVKEHTDES